MFFTNGSTTRRYEPDALAPRCMNNDQDARDGGKPDGDESRRILWIRVHEKVDVVEHRRCFGEGHAVFLLVGRRLGVIPLELALLDGRHGREVPRVRVR